jgi:hypothetical protein
LTVLTAPFVVVAQAPQVGLPEFPLLPGARGVTRTAERFLDAWNDN